MTSFDAWVLRSLLVGRSINGELDDVSSPFQALAREIASATPERAEAVWESFLSNRTDRDAIAKALAEADVDAPPPESDPDDWGPVRLGALPPAMRFPLDVLPHSAAQLAVEGARSIGCAVDFFGAAILAVAGGAIGRSVSLKLKDNYFVSATTFIGCVGPPSDGKTPALKIVSTAIRRIDETLESKYRAELKRIEDEANQAAPAGKKQKPPPPPKPERIDVDDITMEAIPSILADNPRGLIMIRDELSAFVLGMNQFKNGKGNDRSNAMKLWSGDAIKKDRVHHDNNVPIRCPHPYLTILGGMTPDMLDELLDPKGRADGFIDRFLLVYPNSRPVPPWSERGVSRHTLDNWAEMVGCLWSRPMSAKDGRPVPHVAFFTDEGKRRWTAHYDAHAREMNEPDFPPSQRGAWGKLREYAGRLALILACLEHAADPTKNADVPVVGSSAVDNAWRLVEYFKNHTRRIHAAIAIGPESGNHVVKAIAEWIREHELTAFSERDLKQARRWIQPPDLAKALAFLADRNVIRPTPEPDDDKPARGRRRSPAFDVNPQFIATQKAHLAMIDEPEPTFEDFEYFEEPPQEEKQGVGSPSAVPVIPPDQPF